MIFLLKFLSQWPLSRLYKLSNIAAFIAHRVIRYRRTTITQNLRNSFPEKSQAEIKQITREFYHNLSDVAVETLYGYSITAKEMKRRVVFEGMEPINEYYQQQQSIIILAAHQSNWEWLLLAGCLQLPFPVDAIYKKLATKSTDQFMYRLRSRFGGQPIDKDYAARAILKRKNETRAIAIVADQTPSRDTPKDWCSFLNQETGFYPGVEQLPKLTRYPVFFASMYRISRGHYRVQFIPVGTPPYSKSTNLLPTYAQLAQKVIYQQPANWLWSHRRWKYTRTTTELRKNK